MIDSFAWRSIRAASKRIVGRDLNLHVEGREHLPDDGPVLLVARHFHHLYDGCIIMATVPRQVQVLVALDWVERPVALKGMEAACRAAGWPVVYRAPSSVSNLIRLKTLRVSLRCSNDILRNGHVLLVFPEGYPTIDPHPTPKMHRDEFLPFHPGFVGIARHALDDGIPVQTVPVGFNYVEGEDGWRVTVRFGAPILIDRSSPSSVVASRARAMVIDLSAQE